jgi:ATP-dependent DNA helicase RecG
LREILLNAVMHRDYSYYGGHVAIVVFDDRIEIRSYGRLPSGVTLEQLSGPHASELRNPLIAEAFHRTGAVEVWGRGTNRVIAECKAHGILPPSFEERQGWMVVIFRAPIAPVEAAGGPEGGTEKSREKMSERMSEKTPGRILSVLTDHPEATIADLAAVIGVSDRTIERNLKTLQGQNRIRRIGPDKGGRWEVIP